MSRRRHRVAAPVLAGLLLFVSAGAQAGEQSRVERTESLLFQETSGSEP
jgi:hypothetical protein